MLWGGGEEIASIVADVNRWSPQCKSRTTCQIGDFGILVMKDFGSILSMRPDAKAEVLAALREVYDGAWTRHLGTEGGRTLHWEGKVGLIFGSTGVIDAHHSVISGMGDRFLLNRMKPDPAQFKRALAHMGGYPANAQAALRSCGGPVRPAAPRPAATRGR
jgi:hypothetical protein